MAARAIHIVEFACVIPHGFAAGESGTAPFTLQYHISPRIAVIIFFPVGEDFQRLLTFFTQAGKNQTLSCRVVNDLFTSLHLAPANLDLSRSVR